MTTSSARMLILGCPGSGKTTLARRLHAQTGLPLFSLDDEYWGPSWERLPPTAFALRQQELTSGNSWLIEGNYFNTIELRAKHADLIVVLDAPPLLCCWRVLERAWRIRFNGAHHLLPAGVRAVAKRQRVKATTDLPGLLSLILRFRYRYWWRVLEKACGRTQTQIVLAAQSCRRAKWMEAQCAARNIKAAVLTMDALEGNVLHWVDSRLSEMKTKDA